MTVFDLIKDGGPAIRYRARRDLLGEEVSPEETAECLREIEAMEPVQRVLSWQREDGFFGERMHTAPTGDKAWAHEGAVRYLMELGFPASYPPLAQGLSVLLQSGWEKEFNQSPAAIAFGYPITRAALFAQAGLDEQDFVAEWVERSLGKFRTLAEAESYGALAVPRRGGKIWAFLPGKDIPTVYDLRVLAYTDSWRSRPNIAAVRKAFSNLFRWLPLPPTYISHRGQMVAPLGSLAFAVNCPPDAQNGFWWLHLYELMARADALDQTSPFRKVLDALEFDPAGTDAWFRQSYKKLGFTGWSGYSGLALEESWRQKPSRYRDFVFRLLLIRHIAERRRHHGCSGGR